MPICQICGGDYAPRDAKNPKKINAFCPNCNKPEYKHELKRVNSHLERARKAGTPATLTLRGWLKILDHFNWQCAYCNGEFEVLEHIISIPNGGGTTSLNCVPACHTCNSHKDGARGNLISDGRIRRVQRELECITPSASLQVDAFESVV